MPPKSRPTMTPLLCIAKDHSMRLIGVVLLSVLTLTLPCRADDAWPSHPIRIISPGGPGGGFDTSARVIADKLGPALEDAIVVENKPGAGSLLGTEAVLNAPADGYSILLGGLSNIALNVGLYRDLPYDPLKDLVPVGLAVKWSFTLVSRLDLPQKTLKDVIDFARLNPGKMTYGSTGNGTGQHIAMAVTANLAGVKMQHVPYRSAAEAYQDILGGRIDLMFDNTTSAMALVNSGRVRALAVSSPARQSVHPDVPTVAETGVAPLDMETWFGLFVRAGTPAPIIEKLRTAMAEITSDPALIKTFAATGGQTYHLSPQETEALIKNDVIRWKKLITDTGITAD
jgi:tripartite-type tricarboxylate transporter receptor subunit TctC